MHVNAPEEWQRPGRQSKALCTEKCRSWLQCHPLCSAGGADRVLFLPKPPRPVGRTVGWGPQLRGCRWMNLALFSYFVRLYRGNLTGSSSLLVGPGRGGLVVCCCLLSGCLCFWFSLAVNKSSTFGKLVRMPRVCASCRDAVAATEALHPERKQCLPLPLVFPPGLV